jgi:hypothetical protein
VKPKPNSLKIKGKFTLVIWSSDDETRPDTRTIQQEIRSDCQNRTLTSQLGTDRNYCFEYRKRSLFPHNHCGGITFTVDRWQEAARCMNLGIYLGGRKHRLFGFKLMISAITAQRGVTWRETVVPHHGVESAVNTIV